MEKNELRRIYKLKRKELALSEKVKLNEQFSSIIRESFNLSSKNILLYKAISKFSEIPIELLLEHSLKQATNYEVFYPKINTDKNSFEAVKVLSDNWHLDSFGIETPTNAVAVDPSIIDIAFIPLLVFDKQGYRVGYGKGMYDKFLAHCKPDILKVGISYFDPINLITDTHDNDIKLDICICPMQVYTF